MNWFRLRPEAACVLPAVLGVVASGGVGAAAPSAPPAATVNAPRLNYQVTTLPNGLKVVTLEDHSAPVATVQIWYKVGSKEEPAGKAGFAHLFEHLMFKGSENVGPEEHARYVEQIGARYNANTSFDRTLYYETVPINALDRILFLEADRMASLNVDAANLKSERDVVKEEHRLRVDNAPYGKLLENILALVYPAAHPYAHSTIGIMADLDQAKLADVQAFHNQYYKPDNATMVLVGDFQTKEILDKVRKYFGPVPKSKTGDFARIALPDTTQSAEKRETWYDDKAPLPAVGMAFRLPSPDSPDAPVFDVIQQILSAGQSSRLYRSLVRDQQLAVEAQGGALNLRLGGLFFFFAIANAGKEPQTLENALIAEVERLRTAPVTPEELTKSKNQVLTGTVFGLISTEAKASALGESDLLFDTPEEVNQAVEKINKVTAADVQRVAQAYFAPEKRSVFYMLPEAMRATALPTAVPAGAKP